MWIADKWKDYEVIDTSAAAKSWNAGVITLLVRPDPQVIWDTPKKEQRLEAYERSLPPQQKRRR